MPDATVKTQQRSEEVKTDTNLRGRFLWYELSTTDPEAAKSFYKGVIGWNTAPFEGGATPYTLWLSGETPETMVGGVMELAPEAKAAGIPPHWLAYVGTPDVDSTVEHARALGANVFLGPDDIPTVGRIAILKDPQGATFAVFTPAPGPTKPDRSAETGEFSWNELATSDPGKAFSFYQDLFGWEKSTAMDMGPAGIYQLYRREGRDLGGVHTKTPDMPGPPAWCYYILVDDVIRGVEAVKKLGGQVLNGPMEVPGGDWIAQCLDPQAALFAIHHRKK